MVYCESEYAERIRTRQMHAEFLRRQMIKAEEDRDTVRMRELQFLHKQECGEYFETDLKWSLVVRFLFSGADGSTWGLVDLTKEDEGDASVPTVKVLNQQRCLRARRKAENEFKKRGLL